MAVFIIVLIVIVLIIIANGVRIINQYERGVVLRLGKVRPEVKQPGLRLIIPIVDQMRKISMQIVTLPIESQKIITKDNVSIDVSAVAYYQVVDPIKAVVEIQNVVSATYQIAQTTVRNIVGQSSLDEVLSETTAINAKIKDVLEASTEKWGILVSTVEVKDIQLPDSMQRAMAKQAEAEREKRAKVIAAEGEQLSAAKLGEAADIIAKHPIALQLRNLQVLSDIAVEKNSTIVFPAQFMDTVKSIKDFMSKEKLAMRLSLDQLHDLPSPFYRVAVKALIFDERQRLLMVFNEHGNPEVPGGGWEHDESLEDCLAREIREELGVGLKSISPVLFTFRSFSRHGWHVLRLVVRAEVDSTDFRPGDGMTDARFVTRQELLDLPYIDPGDATIKEHVDKIWSKEQV